MSQLEDNSASQSEGSELYWTSYAQRSIWEEDANDVPPDIDHPSALIPKSASAPRPQRPSYTQSFCLSCNSIIESIYSQKNTQGVSGFKLFRLATFLDKEECILCCLIAKARRLSTLDRREFTRYLLKYAAKRPPDSWPRPLYINGLTALTPLKEQIEINGIRTNKVDCIDVTLIKRWLDTCLTKHNKTCGQIKDIGSPAMDHTGPLTIWPYTLILIDVEQHCLVRSTPDIRYFILSYVWGKTKHFCLSTDNLPRLLQKGALKTVESQIPTTILDAISFTAAMGERWLWVDSLCIPQDNKQEKQIQIENMASIYSRAVLSLIHITATNADDPIPGVKKDSRVLRTFYTSPDVSLAVRTNSADLFIANSHYSTRGWTYQERILSPRCLYFTPEQAFLHCQESSFCEDREDEQPLGGMRDLARGSPLNHTMLERLEGYLPDPTARFFRIYRTMVEDYTQKDFTNSFDILNAFTGIMARLGFIFEITFKYGLPLKPRISTLYISSLLWKPASTTFRRDPESYTSSVTEVKAQHSQIIRPHKVERQFPSWSWSAWEGPIAWWNLESLAYLTPHEPPNTSEKCHTGCLVLGGPFKRCSSFSLTGHMGFANEITINDHEGYKVGYFERHSINDDLNSQDFQSDAFAFIALAQRTGHLKPELGQGDSFTVIMVLQGSGEVWERIGLGEINSTDFNASKPLRETVHII
jgi:hypothetical protein